MLLVRNSTTQNLASWDTWTWFILKDNWKIGQNIPIKFPVKMISKLMKKCPLPVTHRSVLWNFFSVLFVHNESLIWKKNHRTTMKLEVDLFSSFNKFTTDNLMRMFLPVSQLSFKTSRNQISNYVRICAMGFRNNRLKCNKKDRFVKLPFVMYQYL